ncbi:hypothetical protein BU24DRAFT_364327 [Aaosphaeria arxii CBS 175.79]|uniref:Uncharacterized protein n=1 Tax=Aaosphaeria arxii CBS 175.79 TaxID=1450172 RepID=A0A6A5Y2A6_9PLEO|nr:uncharacterized protein BU24DRAFT_364327 [Aaosphaeria arxii CBS 175.79]KAF2018960.1 hypothetical protein BU24DRAFT_364327 [Aaosphaeria arxii CBS 175.79]
MKSNIRPMRAPSRPICQLCDYISRQPGYRRSLIATAAIKARSIQRPQSTKQNVAFPTAPRRQFWTGHKLQEQELEIEHPRRTAENSVSLNARLQKVEEQIAYIKDSPKVEGEEVILEVFHALQAIAEQAIEIRSGQPQRAKLNLRQSSAGAILSLNADDSPSSGARRKRSTQASDNLPSPKYISELAVDLVKHPKVFISPSVLEAFVDLHKLIGRPQAIPEILHLYAHKPIPELGSSPPKFLTPSPKGYKQAVPAPIAEKALSIAIDAKDLSLALSVIDYTYCAPAWRSYKLVTKVLPPSIVATITPVALYMIANEMSFYSGYIDPWTFKVYAFMGLFTYATCTGTLGFVAMTTANDHFDRVVWRPGMPLFDRWVREDERAALDKIAGAWGFKESWKRGDEEGEDWEGLRQWILLRDMILDKPDLMPGMNA